jgi:acetyl-CoA acyltransferase 2
MSGDVNQGAINVEEIFVIAGKRTAFGAFGGSLKDISATDLCVEAGKACLAQVPDLDIKLMDHVVIGNVVQSAADAAYLPRHVGLKMGLGESVPAFIVNRLCGSGFQSWINAAQMIRSGEASCVLAGGVEQMSQIPYVARKLRFGGIRMGNSALEDGMTAALTDTYAGLPMAMTAELLAEKHSISRQACDEYSFESLQRFKKASENQIFSHEITPVKVSAGKNLVEFKQDEHPKVDTTLEKMKQLKPLFKDGGCVTAATASGIVDGAAMSIIASKSFVQKHNLKPLAKITGYASVGCDPKTMGFGPVPAIQKLLQKSGKGLRDFDLFEVNEAFAGQFLSVAKALELPMDRTNVNGGAISIGHPLGASGTRIMNHLVYELQRRSGAKTAIGSACIGGGQGIAISIEKI